MSGVFLLLLFVFFFKLDGYFSNFFLEEFVSLYSYIKHTVPIFPQEKRCDNQIHLNTLLFFYSFLCGTFH